MLAYALSANAVEVKAPIWTAAVPVDAVAAVAGLAGVDLAGVRAATSVVLAGVFADVFGAVTTASGFTALGVTANGLGAGAEDADEASGGEGV